jgi:hypothetical protein
VYALGEVVDRSAPDAAPDGSPARAAATPMSTRR